MNLYATMCDLIVDTTTGVIVAVLRGFDKELEISEENRDDLQKLGY